MFATPVEHIVLAAPPPPPPGLFIDPPPPGRLSVSISPLACSSSGLVDMVSIRFSSWKFRIKIEQRQRFQFTVLLVIQWNNSAGDDLHHWQNQEYQNEFCHWLWLCLNFTFTLKLFSVWNSKRSVQNVILNPSISSLLSEKTEQKIDVKFLRHRNSKWRYMLLSPKCLC